MKLQQVLIIFLALVISLLLVTLLAGRNNTTTIVVVASDKIDTNKKLNEQKQYFQEKKILKSDLEQFGEGTLVTSLSQLDNRYLRFALPVGAPIPTGYLSSEKKSGEFAAEMTKNHTIFKIVDGKAALPSQVQPGDKIDIMVILSPANKEDGLLTGPLLTNVTVFSINENDVNVMVSQSNFNKLALAQEIGTFILQLPGQKEDSLHCSEVDEEKVNAVTCYTESDRPSTITEFEIRDFVLNNSALKEKTTQIKDDINDLFDTEDEDSPFSDMFEDEAENTDEETDKSKEDAE